MLSSDHPISKPIESIFEIRNLVYIAGFGATGGAIAVAAAISALGAVGASAIGASFGAVLYFL